MSMNGEEKRSSSRYYSDGDFIHTSRTASGSVSCVLKNISATGACILADIPIEIGEKVFLHVNRGEATSLRGKVVWQNDNEYGIEFLLESSDDFEQISNIVNKFNFRNII
ncbi:MAG TPA: PilZ domain-containing protein [Spirochaetota bacterium]|nr:PilZ domain-containing protein [Spirochaetota bacterium]HOR45294.1 PilZ domain-containing protein [Spirochaetota bacterium]HOU85686.1 PilZ domain-containing protein [Spirochaetota bacterium]HPK55470.1 PilZ domain-containing protein [Spirochaetota bacterium]HQE59793.1 PilZ domain-containing protein [Spirochaetota bacterium]